MSSTASKVASTFEVSPRVFVLGCLSKGVTVYQQQIRALNLAWALSKLGASGDRSLGEVAVVGGGVAGLTFCSAIISITKAPVTLLEQRWDLCPLQQGSDTRWLHPLLYSWPELGSRRPSAGLPVLDWKAGRASDIASQILNKFGDRCMKCADFKREEPTVFLGLGHLRIDASLREIEWIGNSAVRDGRHFRAVDSTGQRRKFGTVVIATGFGLEADQRVEGAIASGSYWRNDTLGQPLLSGTRLTFVVSGHGDGGLVDLCRLTIERFRQDTILSEIFGDDLELVEKEFRALIGPRGGRVAKNVKQLLDGASPPLAACIDSAVNRLKVRLRKDVRVILHVRPAANQWSIDSLFENKSSFLNRVLLYLLYRVGAFVIALDELDIAVKRNSIQESRVVQRHGTAAYDQVLGLFSDPKRVMKKLKNMQNADAQPASPLWPAGFFPPDEE